MNDKFSKCFNSKVDFALSLFRSFWDKCDENPPKSVLWGACVISVICLLLPFHFEQWVMLILAIIAVLVLAVQEILVNQDDSADAAMRDALSSAALLLLVVFVLGFFVSMRSHFFVISLAVAIVVAMVFMRSKHLEALQSEQNVSDANEFHSTPTEEK